MSQDRYSWLLSIHSIFTIRVFEVDLKVSGPDVAIRGLFLGCIKNGI